MDLPRSETRLASTTGARMDRGAKHVAATRFINLIHPHGLQIRLDTPKGRGVFATRAIAAGVVVDISPVLVLPTHESDGTNLAHYTYTWPAEGDILDTSGRNASRSVSPFDGGLPKVSRQALALGLGSMFNHKRAPNIAWERDIPLQSIRYFALRDLAEGEELCISYGPKLWFKDVDGAEEEDVVNEEEALSCDVDVFS